MNESIKKGLVLESDPVQNNPKYLSWVNSLGFIPIFLPYCIQKDSELEYLVRSVDIIIFPGGIDVHPSLYGENVTFSQECDIAFDNWQKKVFEFALKHKKPILGICRGFQLINILLGGRLEQHIDGHNQNLQKIPRSQDYHYIISSDKSHEKIFVNSLHHQGILVTKNQLSPKLVIEFISADGVIESFFSKDLQIYATQFHIEEMNADFFNKKVKDLVRS
jgi:putative glutamine amidotransferase